MSSSPSKKHKQAHDESSPSKKRKHIHPTEDDGTRQAKKARKHFDQKTSKHKQKHHEFSQIRASLVVTVPPVFAANLTEGVEEMLDSMLMRYIPSLRGVVLTHSNLHFLSKAEIRGVSPFAVCRIAFDTTVWSPRVGQRLTGDITLSSPDHIALLIHRTFNAAIPAAHVPRDQWEFVPAADEAAFEEGGDAANPEEHDATTTHGHWVHKGTREPLSGPNRTLSFTVIGLKIANQMLSVVGSILPDPFAPSPIQSNAVENEAPTAAAAPEAIQGEDERPNGDTATRRLEKKKRKKEKNKGEERNEHKGKQKANEMEKGEPERKKARKVP